MNSTAPSRMASDRFSDVAKAVMTTAGHSGGALSFDGVNDWVTIADTNALDLTTGMTMEAWVKPTGGSGWRTVVLKERTGGLAYALYAGGTTGPAVGGEENLSAEDPQNIAEALLPSYGWSSSEMSCLVPLWMGESGWRVNAENSSSGAYGIPQSLPGSKMATAGADWQTNPATQITWGLGYIQERYGSPCGAWGFKQGHGWY